MKWLLITGVICIIVGGIFFTVEPFRGRPIPDCDLPFTDPQPCAFHLWVLTVEGSNWLNGMVGVAGLGVGVGCIFVGLDQFERRRKNLRQNRF